jgi:hypothetical protein
MAKIAKPAGLKEQETLLGVKWWALWDMSTKPYYTLFQYRGTTADGLLHFEQRHNPWVWLSFSQEELGVVVHQNFRPFVRDFKEITKGVANANL